MTTVLLTGEPGSGKTSIVRRVASLDGRAIAGVVSEPILDEEGLRIGIAYRILPDGASGALATLTGTPVSERIAGLVARPSSQRPPHPDPARSDGVSLGPWHFFRDAFETVNAHLVSVAASPTDRGGPAVAIDEIGPLELVRRDGFHRGFRTVMATELRVLVVVRPSLVPSMRALIASAYPHRKNAMSTVSIFSPDHVGPTSERILAMLAG